MLFKQAMIVQQPKKFSNREKKRVFGGDLNERPMSNIAGPSNYEAKASYSLNQTTCSEKNKSDRYNM